jgi:glutamate 5-kinase
MHELQAAAAVGQMGLAQCYESCFRSHGLRSAQVLLTNADMADRQRYLNARSTLRTLLGLNVIPVINENDTVATDEIKLGDNDTLAALVTNLIEADALVILTDQPGCSRRSAQEPPAKIIRSARPTPAGGLAGGAGSRSAGGMLTKVLAAARGARAHTVIASGVSPRLVRLAAASDRDAAHRRRPLAARKQWLADHLQLAAG